MKFSGVFRRLRGSGSGRGPILDGFRQAALWCHQRAQVQDPAIYPSVFQSAKNGLGRSEDHRKRGMRRWAEIIAAQRCVGFSGILHGPQVIADRDDGKENHDEHGKSDDRITPALPRLRFEKIPQGDQDQGHQEPDEIEEEFHAHIDSILLRSQLEWMRHAGRIYNNGVNCSG